MKRDLFFSKQATLFIIALANSFERVKSILSFGPGGF
jgi:hypothetical protein